MIHHKARSVFAHRGTLKWLGKMIYTAAIRNMLYADHVACSCIQTRSTQHRNPDGLYRHTYNREGGRNLPARFHHRIQYCKLYTALYYSFNYTRITLRYIEVHYGTLHYIEVNYGALHYITWLNDMTLPGCVQDIVRMVICSFLWRFKMSSMCTDDLWDTILHCSVLHHTRPGL